MGLFALHVPAPPPALLHPHALVVSVDHLPDAYQLFGSAHVAIAPSVYRISKVYFSAYLEVHREFLLGWSYWSAADIFWLRY